MESSPTSSSWWPWLVLTALLVIAAVLWQPLLLLFSTEADSATLQAEVQALGLLAPLAFLALSVLQIVGAPIPGYPVQILGGALFGLVWGGIYNVLGLLLGGLTAAWLARRLGRPFIEKHVEAETLARYENLARLNSLWVWFIFLTIPVGDIPYFLAGLSKVRLSTLVLATLLARGPTSFLIAWFGEQAVNIPRWIFLAMFVAILALIGLGYALKDHLRTFFDRYVLHHLQ